MTNRIDALFSALDRPALVTFITAGDPDLARSQQVLESLPAAGADIIELGMPFTDPMADGPTIQASSLRALAAGASMVTTMKMVRDFRRGNTATPVVLMGYANPVFQYGYARFADDCAAAGVDGLIIVDLPPEEDGELFELVRARNIHLIKLLTPTTAAERLQAILPKASGFLYYVTVTGITGGASADVAAVKRHVAEIRRHTDLPIAAGFGIRTPQDVAAFRDAVDAVVVGSAIVNAIGTPGNDVPALVGSLSAALQPAK